METANFYVSKHIFKHTNHIMSLAIYIIYTIIYIISSVLLDTHVYNPVYTLMAGLQIVLPLRVLVYLYEACVQPCARFQYVPGPDRPADGVPPLHAHLRPVRGTEDVDQTDHVGDLPHG